ncbi:MAG: hypothetical protein J0I12_22765 [Candidatus Eremiobacteraeota bacterium]|nr:hypothetical protein [Candidatus Eremiobacteraeota bacterium]
MNSKWILTLFWLTVLTGLLAQAGSGAALVGLSRLLVLVFASLAAISLALHEGRKTLA